ncbi:hypothetical protein BDR04DRAFT_1127448 [Suillus decipiens]|nr:hypothetical protein BDR04DRAFT_1127448 [Suillus decipiens]
MFKNKSGLTKHTCIQHSEASHNRKIFHQAAPSVRSPSPEAWPGYDHLDFGGPNPDAEFEIQEGFVPQDGTWDDWTPYKSCITFEMANFLFSWNQTSAKQIDTLLDLWAASLIKHDDAPPFTDHHDLYNTIDAMPLGNVPWETFSMSYTGAKPLHDIPPWMDATYDVWFRNPHLLLHDMLGNPNFNGKMEYNFFLGDWAWRQADIIAQDEVNDGSTFMPLIIGSNKTTVLVATGHTEYHPLYIKQLFPKIVPLSLLTFYIATKEHAVFHCSLSKIFDAIKPYMDTPDVACFPDGHFHRVIYGLDPYIADYPEQVLLSGVVQGWCPKCLADQRDLDSDEPCLCWCKKHREFLIEELEYGKLWDEYGIVSDLVPFMNNYPQVDIHNLISPDILHQIIKGTFKDHLVDWVESYLKIMHGTSHAAQIMDDIDNNDDSKALMKVYLPAIRGHVPDDVVHMFSAFLDFCYIDDLLQLQDALDRFHRYWEIFKITGITMSFSLPRQHSLNHYLLLIQQFGTPNGLCSSIMESKHIKAVKEPWRRSSQFKALGQMFLSINEPEHRSIEGEAGETVDGPAVEAHVDLATTPYKLVCPLCCRCDVRTLGKELELPNFPQLIQKFIHNQAHAADPDHPIFDPSSAPLFLGKVAVFNSATASFYAPSDLSSTGDTDIMNGLTVAHQSHIFFQCAVIWWFSHVLDACDPDTGMYVVAPTTLEDNTPDISIIHIDCIFCAVHFIPLYSSNFLPHTVTSHDSYNIFHSYFINKYADHHAFEIV